MRPIPCSEGNSSVAGVASSRAFRSRSTAGPSARSYASPSLTSEFAIKMFHRLTVICFAQNMKLATASLSPPVVRTELPAPCSLNASGYVGGTPRLEQVAVQVANFGRSRGRIFVIAWSEHDAFCDVARTGQNPAGVE